MKKMVEEDSSLQLVRMEDDDLLGLELNEMKENDMKIDLTSAMVVVVPTTEDNITSLVISDKNDSVKKVTKSVSRALLISYNALSKQEGHRRRSRRLKAMQNTKTGEEKKSATKKFMISPQTQMKGLMDSKIYQISIYKDT